jgi:hypothetical protein
MKNSARQEEMAIPNGKKGDGNGEGIMEDANEYQPVGPQVGDGDYWGPFMVNHFI